MTELWLSVMALISTSSTGSSVVWTYFIKMPKNISAVQTPMARSVPSTFSAVMPVPLLLWFFRGARAASCFPSIALPPFAN